MNQAFLTDLTSQILAESQAATTAEATRRATAEAIAARSAEYLTELGRQFQETADALNAAAGGGPLGVVAMTGASFTGIYRDGQFLTAHAWLEHCNASTGRALALRVRAANDSEETALVFAFALDSDGALVLVDVPENGPATLAFSPEGLCEHMTKALFGSA